MAGIENIISTILADAGREAGYAAEEGERNAQRMRAEACAELERALQQIQLRTQQDIQETRRRIQAVAALEVRKADLYIRRRIVDQVFEVARQRLLELSAQEYEQLLLRLALENASDGGEIILSNCDTRFTAEMMQRINETLEQRGSAALTLSGDRGNFSGGFILVKSGVEVDCSFEALLRIYRDELEAEVAQRLFGEG